MRWRSRLRSSLLGVACCAACQNAGQDRVLGVQATGIIKGLVYFDRDGNHIPDAADTVLAGIGTRLIVSGAQDTIGRAVSDTAGLVRFGAVPVGTVVLSVDATTIPGDSLQVTRIDVPTIRVTPGDSFVVRIAVSYPEVTVAQARALAIGKKVFVTGIALNNAVTFGDSTVHFADTSGAILATGFRTPFVFTGDSDRVLGTRQTRNSQPTLDHPTVFTLAVGAAPPLHQTSTVLAASANGGPLDAALVRVVATRVLDTATAAGNRRLTVNDGSGPLVIQLDTIAGFRGAALAADTVGARLDATGLLAATGAGTWFLLPRTPSDLIAR